ncbi:MAG: metal ABC transporter substrate-binding protein [Clostridia bacterium]|nr:metal ABC transporter substrate-binding protein [Clostridia bacterium]
MRKKRIITGLLIVQLTAGGLFSIAAFGESAKASKLNVVATVFPAYDFARAVVGERAEVTMLLSPGVESHSYEPTPQSIIKIRSSDLFLYIGGTTDVWVERVLGSIEEGTVRSVALVDCVHVLEEEIVEGMEADPEEEHEHDGDEREYDEHVWTSPRNAQKIVLQLAEVLAEADPEGADIYRDNAAMYARKLRTLDTAYQDVVDHAVRKTLVFGDRFPFRYLAADYGLTYYAAFPGCSTETEPSVKTVAFLIDKVREEGIPVVFHIELANEKMADAICDATGAKKLLLHACHNIAVSDFEQGVTCVDLMTRNVDALKEALW